MSLFVASLLNAPLCGASLSIGSVPAYPGSVVTMPVRLAAATNVTAMQFDLAFNPTRSTPTAAIRSGAFSNHIVHSREIAPGVRRVLAYSLANAAVTITNSSQILSLPFSVPATEYVGSGPLLPRNAVLAHRDATSVEPLMLTPGSIFVRPVNPLADGTVQFFLPSEPDERYLIQATTNFLQWINLTNLTAFGDFMDLVDIDAAKHPYRFYRWVRSEAAGRIGSVSRAPNGLVTFTITGLESRIYAVQASTDLETWIDLSTNAVVGGSVVVTDLDAGRYRQRFYRLKSF